MQFPIQIICEGASEANYIAQLNRILISGDGRFAFSYKEAGGGRPGPILKALSFCRKINRKLPCWLFLDEDIYVREPSLETALRSKTGNATILFNRMNFEDMIMLHQSSEQLKAWLDICESHHHFNTPMEESIYYPKIKTFFPDYQKRQLPFELTKFYLEQAFMNLHQQNKIRSEFLCSIADLIDKGTLIWR